MEPIHSGIMMNIKGNYMCECRFMDLKKLKEDEEVCSEVFSVGTAKWKVCIFPYRGIGDINGYLSVFLALVDCPEIPISTGFSISVVSQSDFENGIEDPYVSLKKGMTHVFKDNNKERVGWENFITHAELHDPANSFYVDDSIDFQVEIYCCWPIAVKEEEAQGYDDEEVDAMGDDGEDDTGKV